MLTPSSVAGMQLIMWGENMIALVVGWVGKCCSEHSLLELLYLSQTPKILNRISLRYFGEAYSF